jgi:hypothetical protein
MDTDRAWYAFCFYSHLMTKQERLAYAHLVGTIKATGGRSDADAQEEVRSTSRRASLAHASFRYEWLSDDPEVLRLAKDGYKAFAVSTGERIFRDHRDQIVLNCCPQCGRLARTPKARQCRFCRHDWHNENAKFNLPKS